MSIDFRSDPIGNRFKGWKQPAYNPRTKLVSGWEPRPEFGAGQSEGLLPDATQPLVPDDEAGLPPPLPYDWGAIRAAVFPQGLGPAPDPDPDLTAHLGGSVAKPAASVYDPSQARTLSLAAPASKPPARPPAASTSAQAAGGPGGAPRSSSQQQFVSDLLPTAQAMGRRLGIPWQVLMAIPANETGWGASVFHNNYFGIKGPGAPARTWEVVNGKRQDITDSFRTFDSPEGSMAGFAQLMQDNPRYAPALEQLRKDPTNWPAFVSMIHSAGYATDPQWAQKVIRIGQGLESADSMPHAGMSTVTPTGSLLDVARSPLGGKHPAGGTNQPSGYVFPVQGYTQTVPDHWGEVKGGSDLFAPRGTPVMAMRGGKVVSAGNNSVGGNAVTIQGDDGLEYYYAHLDAPPSVKTGDTISAGTFLGPVGDTGNAKGKGTHLHIGIGPSIREGSDKYGGTGGDFDAVGLMNNVLKGDTSATKGTYTDDASYVAWAYRNGLGKNLPSTVNALYVSSKPISAKDALPGDLVMYNMSGDPSQQHVAIYAGDGQMLHNNDGVKQEGVWPGAEFRRLSGVKPGQLSRPTRTPSPAIANPIVKYRDNGNNTWTATHTDGSTTLEHSLTTIAPVEGGRHPMTIRPGFGKMGGGQEGFTDGGGGGLDPSTPQETPEQRRAREDAEWDKRWKEYQQSQEGTSPFILGGVGDALGALGTATQPARDTVGETIGGAASALGTTAQGTVAQATAPAQLAPGQQSARDQLGQAAQPVGEALGTAAQPVGEALGTAAQGVVNQATAPAQLAPGQQSARDQIGEALGATAETVVPPVARTGGNALQAFGEATGSPSEAYPAGGPLAGPITGEFRQEAGTQQLTKEFEQQTGVSYADFEKRLATEGASGNFSPETVALSDVWNSLGGMAGALPAYSRMSPEEQAAQAETPGALASTLISTALMPGTVVKTPIGMIRAAAAMVAAPGNIPIVGPLTAAEEIGRATEVGAPLIKALAKSPVGKFLVEDGGQASLNMMGKTGLATGGGGVLGSAIGVSPDIANPRIDDPNWWAQVKNDAAVGFGTGALVGMGVTGAKYGLDQTITPSIMEAFRAVFNPRENIPDPLAQVAAADRANAINLAGTWADIIRFQGGKLFGKPGTGLNTAEAAAFAETKRTLVGFTAADGSSVTPAQEAWLQERLAYEDMAQRRLDAAKVLGPTQNVVTSGSLPGPKVHISHLYTPEVADAQQNATRGQRLGWRDAPIVKARAKTIDPAADPGTPRTIREALDEYARDKLNNKEPLNDLVTRFEVSAYQTEKTLANRAFYDAIKPPGVAGPGASVAFQGVAPDTWVRPKEQWGFGHGVDQMRFEPKLAKYLDNISGATESADWLRWYGENVSAPLKAGLFVGSPIHAFNVAWRAFSELGALKTADLFRSYIMPTMFSGGYGNLLLARLPLALDSAEHGLTGARVAAEGITPRYGATGGMVRTGVAGLAGAGMGWTQARARGQTEDEAKQAALWGAALSIPMTLPGAGAIIKAFGKDVDVEAAASMADVLHHGIFREGMPAAKLGMYEILTKAGVDKDIAATTINNTIGGIDQLKMGRSPWVQDLMRYGLIASDWTEGQVKTMANAFMPNQMGAHTRQSVVRGLATYMGEIEILNRVLNGHPTWENGDGNEYKLEVTGLLDGLYHLSGNQVDLRSIDPVDKTPQRSFVDVMPPMRWMMETIGEGSRQLAYNQGQLESTFGGPAGAAAGQRLQDYAGPDLVKPSLRDKLIEDVQSRIGPGPGLIGAASEAAKGQQYDWTGKPMEKPDFSTWTGWADWAGHLVSPFAPASGTAVMRNINVPHPERSEWGDAVTEFLGLTRVNRTSELGEKRSEADEIKKKVLNISPDEEADIEAKHQAQIDANDQKRVAAFAALEAPDSTVAHVDHEKTMHDIATERKPLTTRQNIAESYAAKVPQGPLRDTVQQILENVWNVPGSPLSADLKPTTDVAELAKNYWSPTGINVTDDLALRKARRNILNEFAYTHDEDPDALEDLIKWQAQHQDDLSKSTPPPKALPGVSSGQLGQIATDYLQAGEDEHGHLIEDIDVRGDKMRAFLKDNAKQIGVTPENLMERINLRLAGVAQTTPIERSYNTALQTFFQSHDEDQFPRYKNADGTPLGDRAKWDIWDEQIASLGQAKAKNFEEWQGRVEAKERAQNDRDKWLLNHTSRTDYERWFGVGRGMTERRWQEYRTGTGPVGYEDLALDKDLQPPKDETARRDRIQQMYRASNLDERLDTEVWVWQQGDYVPMNLKGAERYIRHFQIPEPGRKLDDLAAHDEADPKLRPSLRLDTVEEAANATK